MPLISMALGMSRGPLGSGTGQACPWPRAKGSPEGT